MRKEDYAIQATMANGDVFTLSKRFSDYGTAKGYVFNDTDLVEVEDDAPSVSYIRKSQVQRFRIIKMFHLSEDEQMSNHTVEGEYIRDVNSEDESDLDMDVRDLCNDLAEEIIDRLRGSPGKDFKLTISYKAEKDA